jgi:sugar lactone lactonase YvrE
MNTPRLCDLRTVFPRPFVLLLAGFIGLAPLSARGQFATLLDTTSRFAGNSTGSSAFNGDTGVATATTLNVPNRVVFDSFGNLYISDKQNNCVRKVDTSGNISTVAGLRVSGNASDTCNTASIPGPDPTQGLLAPTGLAIDSSNTLYIADSQHNCVRSLASGVVDNFAHPALTTVAGTCTFVNTSSVTPVPDGLVVDSSSNLYISINDSLSAIPVYQVVRHLAGALATTICAVAGQTSPNAANTLCAGITSTVSLDRPAGLAFDENGNLFIADTGNNCVREIAGMTTQRTTVGQCTNDLTGSTATALNNPYGLAFSADASLYISESGSGHNNLVSFNFGTNTLSLIAGLPSGASGPYNVSQEGQAALLVPLNQPLGVATDTGGSIYLADSQNNIVRRMGTNLSFPNTNVGSTSASQTIVFSINQTVNLTLTVGTDFNLVGATCSGSLTHSANPICQVVLTFSPSRPGYRYSALQLKDSISGKLISVELQGLGLGPLSLLAPGVASTRASSLRTAIAVSTDSAGDAYVLERGNGSSTADVLFYPAAGGAAQVVVAQGAGMVSPTAMGVDGAGNIFIADSGVSGLGGGNIIRFGADGSVNTSYATSVLYVNAMAVDGFGDLFLAEGGSVHSVTEIYAGGQRRVVAGSGSVVDANNVPATSAVFYDPSGIALGPNGIAVADAGTHYVYLIDNSGIIHIVAGNGATSTTSPGVATGTGLLTPDGLAIDAASDIYIADDAANIVYAVFSVISNGTNIYPVIGTGTPGYTGDGGPSTAATLNAPLAIALDGSSDLFVIDSANNALREVSYPRTSTIGFGNVLINTTSAPPMLQFLANAGNVTLAWTSLPFTTTDTLHYNVSAAATTCTATTVSGGVCDIGYTFTPTAIGPAPAGQSNLFSNSYNSQQTVFFNSSGSSGYSTGPLPFTLLSETEVYGYSFSESFTFTGIFPASGSIVFYYGSQILCQTTISNASAGTVTCNANPSGLPVGTYPVNFTFTSTNSYYLNTNGTTTLNVTKAPLTINVNSYTRRYGTPNPTCGWTISGVVNNDVINVTCSISATTLSPVGTYTITANVTGANIANYNVLINFGTLIITQSTTPLVIAVNNATRPYDTSNPPFSSTITGEAPGDTFNITYSTSATITSPVGNYAINGSVSGANLSNYSSIQVVSGTLSITPATTALVVSCNSASRQYGTANPTFGYAISGLLNGDNVTVLCSTTATIASPVGGYAITPSISGPAAANYSLTAVQGTLTITPAPAVTITVNSVSRPYGTPNPTFTDTVSGALNGDSFTLSYSTAAVLTSPIGLYPINASITGGSSLSNYSTVTVLPGTLAITQASTVTTVTTSASPVTPGTNITFTATVTYGAGLPVTAATVNFYNGTTLLCAATLNSSGVATCTTSTLPVGSYTITATYQATLGYASSSGTVLQIVAPAPTVTTVTTSASPVTQGASVTFTATVTYGAGAPVTAATVNFYNGTTPLCAATLNASGVATCTTSTLPVGTLTITATYQATLDFASSSGTVTQVVNTGSFTLSAAPPNQFISGPGSSVYAVTVSSVQSFAGPVALACSGLPADATCTFATPTVTLTGTGDGANVTTTMTVTTTLADARLTLPALPTPADRTPNGLAPIAFAAVFPFGLGAFLGFSRRRRGRARAGRSPNLRLLLALLCTAAIVSLAGCACLSSINQVYTIPITGTTTVSGVAAQSTSVSLTVAQE